MTQSSTVPEHRIRVTPGADVCAAVAVERGVDDGLSAADVSGLDDLLLDAAERG